MKAITKQAYTDLHLKRQVSAGAPHKLTCPIDTELCEKNIAKKFALRKNTDHIWPAEHFEIFFQLCIKLLID